MFIDCEECKYPALLKGVRNFRTVENYKHLTPPEWRTPSNLLWHGGRDTKFSSTKRFMTRIHIAVTRVT